MSELVELIDKEIKSVENAYHKYEFSELHTLMSIQVGYDPETATEEEKEKAEPIERDIKVIMGKMEKLLEFEKLLKSVKLMREELLNQNKDEI